jgi:hypothetical protein
MSDDQEFFGLILTMIMVILTHSDMNHSDHELTLAMIVSFMS